MVEVEGGVLGTVPRRGEAGARLPCRPPGCEACFLLHKGGILIHLSHIKSAGKTASSPLQK